MYSCGELNSYQLLEEDEFMMEQLGNLSNMEFYEIRCADIMNQLRSLNPDLHSKISSSEGEMYLSKVNKYLIYKDGGFRIKPSGYRLLRDINFSKRIEHPRGPLPEDVEAVKDGDFIKKYLQELQDEERRLNPRPAPIIEAGMSPELEYLVRKFNGRRKARIDANTPDISKQGSTANSFKDWSGSFGWKAKIMSALALRYPNKVKVVMDQARPAFLSLNGEMMAYEGIEALKQIDAGVVYNSEECSLQITDMHQFLKNPCVDEQYRWLTEFYNLFENLTVIIDVCGGKLNLRDVEMYTFETKVVADALTHALSICFRLPHIFSFDRATISYDKDVLQGIQREGRLY